MALSQYESGHEELGIRAYNKGDGFSDNNEVIVLEAVSPVWIPDHTSSGFPPVEADTFKFGWSSKIDTIEGLGQTLVFAAEVAGGTEPADFRFAWGKYKVTFGYNATYESGVLTGYDERYYFYVDFADTMYGMGGWTGYSGFADFRFDFEWDSLRVTYYEPRNPDSTWKDPIKPTVNIWEYEWIKPNSVSRNTAYLIPPAPKDFSLTGGGSIQLSWQSNAESFAIKYMIYRKINSGNYNLIDSVSNSSYQGQIHTYNWTDPDIGCTNGHQNSVCYFIRAKNTSGSPYHFSEPTDTLNTDFGCYMEKGSIDRAANNLFALYPNYPNPFNPSTEISYQLPSDEYVSLKIYNTLGQEVRSLVRETQSAGLHKVIWDGKNRFGQAVPSGVYLYRLETKSFSKTMKMIMMK